MHCRLDRFQSRYGIFGGGKMYCLYRESNAVIQLHRASYSDYMRNSWYRVTDGINLACYYGLCDIYKRISRVKQIIIRIYLHAYNRIHVKYIRAV